ncbi:SHOCT domain-containing protein [Deferribacterales bacterium Es71-Z0220]|uniref:SHOCT domain-containing protein n=1 Tax=Deferrivibrio essentukiensis TaxID=2880922 RepID=UPI001F607CF4|nr:SHOCT domain-containing protein [Deferrivibrio essentukiensis]MCB4205196.1 SHOCT domain-containing protein [Deferrivibrio essentukiensis]
MMYDFYGGHGFMWIFGMGIWLVVIIFVLYLLVKIPGMFFTKNNNYNDALDILKTRYAKGEITEEEFENMKNVLRK